MYKHSTIKSVAIASKRDFVNARTEQESSNQSNIIKPIRLQLYRTARKKKNRKEKTCTTCNMKQYKRVMHKNRYRSSRDSGTIKCPLSKWANSIWTRNFGFAVPGSNRHSIIFFVIFQNILLSRQIFWLNIICLRVNPDIS